MTNPKAWIEKRRAIHAEAKEYPAVVPQSPTWMNALKAHGEYELDAKVNFPQALDALEQVLGLHVKGYETAGAHWCSECEMTWPCATVQAIEGAIND